MTDQKNIAKCKGLLWLLLFCFRILSRFGRTNYTYYQLNKINLKYSNFNFSFKKEMYLLPNSISDSGLKPIFGFNEAHFKRSKYIWPQYSGYRKINVNFSVSYLLIILEIIFLILGIHYHTKRSHFKIY